MTQRASPPPTSYRDQNVEVSAPPGVPVLLHCTKMTPLTAKGTFCVSVLFELESEHLKVQNVFSPEAFFTKGGL